MMARKLGFITTTDGDKPLEDFLDTQYEMIKSFFNVLEECSTDFTNTFRFLQLITKGDHLTEGDRNAIDLLV